MTDISVVVLARNERLHIARCLGLLASLEPMAIFVVDSLSTDGTQTIIQDIATSLKLNIKIVEHEWPGNQANQFNWALDNLHIASQWILRLDADEWLTPELIAEIKTKLPVMPLFVNGVVLKRRHYVGWLGGKWIRRGMYPARILRLFRTGKARYSSDMAMDEHLIVNGETIEFDNDFVDESLLTFERWRIKHIDYAKREAKMVLTRNANHNKRMYYMLPPYLRAFAYFCMRYFLKFGFMDGFAGLRWHFWHGLWYRCLVDMEIQKGGKA